MSPRTYLQSVTVLVEVRWKLAHLPGCPRLDGLRETATKPLVVHGWPPPLRCCPLCLPPARPVP